MGEKMTPCAECGMPCEAGEYHPYAACLMFKGCHNSATVRANLTQPAQAVDVGAIREVIAELSNPSVLHAPYVTRCADKLTAALPNANGKEGP